MEQLKVAWVYRFWIAVGVIVLLPVIGYFVDTSTLAKDADRKGQMLESEKKALDSLAKKDNPNEKWTDGVKKLKEVMAKDVDGTWVKLYERQVKFMEWPKEVEATFKYAEITGQPVAADVRLRYRDLYPNQFKELLTRVKSVAEEGKEPQVLMDPGVVDIYRAPWVAAQYPPSVEQGWEAQEVIWILRALLDIVAKVNEGSPEWRKSPIMRIIGINLGAAALDQSGRTEPLYARNTAPQTTKQQQKQGQASGTLQYVGTPDQATLFRQVPVALRLIVDQRKIPDIVALFESSDLPMQIRELQIADASADADAMRTRALTGDASRPTTAQGAAPRKQDEFFHMTDLEIRARAILYNKPPAIAEQEKAQAQAAGKSPTPGDAPK